MSSDDLVRRAFDGLLDEREEAELADRIAREPDLALEMVRQAREETLLHEWAGDRRVRARLVPSREVRSTGFPRRSAAVAALLLAALIPGVLLLVGRPAPFTAEVVDRAGEVDVPTGAVLAAGDAVRTGPGGRVTLRLKDDSLLDLGGSSFLTLGGDEKDRRVRLERGVLRTRIRPMESGRTFGFHTAHANAWVLGTEFELRAGPDRTRLTVTEGRVRVVRKEDGAETVVPAGEAAIVRPGIELASYSATGSGLRADYFDRTDLTGLRMTRIDPAVDFRWNFSSPHYAVHSETFSARWTGRVVPAFSETYTFHAEADDGVRLWVGGELLIDHWVESPKTVQAGRIALNEGEPADFRLEFFDQGGPATVRLSWSSPSLPKEIIPPRSLLPASVEGSGLKAEYFSEDDLTGLSFTRLDPIVDFDWELGSPHPDIPPDHFSIRWTGKIVPKFSERTTFHVESDDGVRLWIDGKPAIDDWTIRGTREHRSAVMLEAGRVIDVRLEYFDCVHRARVSLMWSSPSLPREVIPQSRLHPSE